MTRTILGGGGCQQGRGWGLWFGMESVVGGGVGEDRAGGSDFAGKEGECGQGWGD